MKRSIFFLTSLAVAGPLNAMSLATKVDADQLQHDERSGVTIFQGNVSLSRGSLLLKGDRLELKQMPDGSSKGSLSGKPAMIRQQRLDSQEWVVGEAYRIDYDSASQVSVLEGQASMKRLQGETLRDHVAGERLRYNSITEEYQVESGSDGRRSRMTLMPSGRQGQ